MKGKLKNIFEYINAHNTYVAILALIVSFFSLIWNYSLQEKNTRYSTYNMDLCYKIEFSEDIKEENVSFYDEQEKALVVSNIGYINVIPKVGGIHKITIFINQRKEDFVFFSTDDVISDVVDIYEAQNASYAISNFILNIYAEDDDYYYSSIYLLIEDYNHNFYTNMITFKIDKDNFANIEPRVYDEIDLLYTYNKDEDYLDWFDNEQMKRYLILKNKLDKITKNR